MYCPKCGAANGDNSFRCVACGEIIQPLQQVQSANMADSAVMRALLPIGRSWWAIAAGYAGLFSLLLVPAPFALLLGVLALRDLRNHPHLYGKGRAVFALIMGGLGSAGLVWAVLLA